MEIHKPKLARNWREFAIEMGTIVCGILIALGLDQTAEWLHRRAEVAEAREALRPEIAANATLARITVQEAECVNAGMERLVAWFQGGPLPGNGPKNVGLTAPVSSTWEVAKVGAAAHMPLAERMAYSRFYDMVQTDLKDFDSQTAALQGASVELGGFLRAGARPGPHDAAVMRGLGEISVIRNVASRRSRGSVAMIEAARAMACSRRRCPLHSASTWRTFAARSELHPAVYEA